MVVVGCAGEDNLSAMATLGSAAVFHTVNEAKPRRLGGDRCAFWLFEIANAGRAISESREVVRHHCGYCGLLRLSAIIVSPSTSDVALKATKFFKNNCGQPAPLDVLFVNARGIPQSANSSQ
jgi:hypothetical protein